MASTTNFGWQTPDDTDLVKDGAAAIRTLGSAIDTSLVDLKGGTSGQILAKNSNTDMDFVWITNDVGDITEVVAGTGLSGGGSSGSVTLTNTVATEFDAKGDLVVGTGADTFDKLSAGNNGESLVADSSTTTGLRWQGNFAAGKNKIINGDFSINERRFTSTTTDNTYGFDRWNLQATDGTVTFSSEAFTIGSAPVAGYEAVNFARIVTTGQTATNARGQLQQRIENVRTLANQTATVSFWAKAATGTPKVSIEFQQNFGTGGSPSAAVNTLAGQITLSTSWTRYTATVALPSLSGKTVGTDNNSSYLNLVLWVSAGTNFDARLNSLGIQSNTFDFWGVQVEAGNVATAFQTATGTLAGELAACQRYYYRATIDAIGGRLGSGYINSTVELNLTVPFPVTMRTKPTALEQTGTAADYQVLTTGNTITTCNSVPSISTATQAMQAVVSLGVSGGLTAGQGATMRAATAGAYLGWSAEL